MNEVLNILVIVCCNINRERIVIVVGVGFYMDLNVEII